MAQQSSGHNFLIQSYFVLASLLGLLLIVMGAVNGVRLGLHTVLGVKPYPSFTAPYPNLERFPGEKQVENNTDDLTQEQRDRLTEWQSLYDQWQEQEREYNSQDQQIRREIAWFLAMLAVGIPVFAIHSPYVFRKK